MDRRARILKAVLAAMIERAQEQPHLECCGLLGYEIAPEDLFRLLREMRRAGLELAGIYHSHPNRTSEPSADDVQRAYYPDATYFIVSPGERSTAVRAFTIRDGRVDEVPIEEIGTN